MTKETKEQVMTEVKEEQVSTLEMAPEAKPFLDGDYFQGLCEIAAACNKKLNLYIPETGKGIFNSLYFKRVFARKVNEDGSWSVGNFVMQNRYLYNYDRLTRTYGSKKEDNYVAFIKRVKEIIAKNDFKIFSLEKTVQVNELDEILNA